MRENLPGRPERSSRLVVAAPVACLPWVQRGVVPPPAWALTPCRNLHRQLGQRAASTVGSAARTSRAWVTIMKTSSQPRTTPTQKSSRHLHSRPSKSPTRRRHRRRLQRAKQLIRRRPRRNQRSPRRRRMTHTIQNLMVMMTTIQMIRTKTQMIHPIARRSVARPSVLSVRTSRASHNLRASQQRLPLLSSLPKPQLQFNKLRQCSSRRLRRMMYSIFYLAPVSLSNNSNSPLVTLPSCSNSSSSLPQPKTICLVVLIWLNNSLHNSLNSHKYSLKAAICLEV